MLTVPTGRDWVCDGYGWNLWCTYTVYHQFQEGKENSNFLVLPVTRRVTDKVAISGFLLQSRWLVSDNLSHYWICFMRWLVFIANHSVAWIWFYTPFNLFLACAQEHERKITWVQYICDEILSDIFGKKIGSVYVEGIVDAKDSKDLQPKLGSIISKSDVKELDKFLSRFSTSKVPIIRDTMLGMVWQECGLGCPPEPFTTNACEAANFMLKNKVDYKHSDLPAKL